MIGLPPVKAGSAHLTVAWAFPAVASGLMTADGFVAGVTGLVVASGPVPTKFVAVIEKV